MGECRTLNAYLGCKLSRIHSFGKHNLFNSVFFVHNLQYKCKVYVCNHVTKICELVYICKSHTSVMKYICIYTFVIHRNGKVKYSYRYKTICLKGFIAVSYTHLTLPTNR